MERKSLKEFLCDRTPSYVLRWHNRPTVWKENLAEHQFYVARISFWLAELATPGYGESAMLAGLFHDELETITGDIPSPIKHGALASEAVKQCEEAALVQLSEQVPFEFSDTLPMVIGLHDSSSFMLRQIVQYADMLAALAYIEDQLKGGMRSNSILAIYDAIIRDMAKFDWPWLKLLRLKHPELP